MRRPLTLALLALSLAGLLAAFALVPGDLERIAMLQRDGETEAAARLANGLFERGDRRGPLLARVFELNYALGRAERAGEALRLYLARVPDNARTLAKAAEFFELEQDLPGTFSALESLVRVAPTAVSVGKLARLYRLHGRFGDEEALLWNHRRLLQPDLASRLGALLARREDRDGALAVLRAADDRFPTEHELFAPLLFDLLVRQDAPDEAERRARRWVADDRDGHRRVPMVLGLINAGAADQAIRLAEAPSAGNAERDAVLSTQIWALASHGHAAAAGRLVEDLPECRATRAARDAVRAYVTFAQATGAMPEVLGRALRLTGSTDMAAVRHGLCIATAVFDHGGLSALAPLRRRLTADMLADDPALAARIALAENQPVLSGAYLSDVDLTDADDDLLTVWLDVARHAYTPSQLAHELVRRRLGGHLPSALIPELQSAIHRAGLFRPEFDPVTGHPAANGREARIRGVER